MLHFAVENTACANRLAISSAADTSWASKRWAGLARWSSLTGAALCCLRETSGVRSKRILAQYLLENLIRRCGLRVSLDEEVSLRLGNIQVNFRPLHGELYLYKEIFVDEVYERHPAFRLCPGWCVFDVGANIGMFTLKAAAKSAVARTYAFEPDPGTFGRLLANLRSNALANVVPVQKALGKAAGVTQFVRGSASTVGHLTGTEGQAGDSELLVEVAPLSAVMHQYHIPVVNLLKLDVEGAEVDVLRGAQARLDCIERIVMEYHSAELLEECECILQCRGFRKVLEVPPSYAYFLGAPVGL